MSESGTNHILMSKIALSMATDGSLQELSPPPRSSQEKVYCSHPLNCRPEEPSIATYRGRRASLPDDYKPSSARPERAPKKDPALCDYWICSTDGKNSYVACDKCITLELAPLFVHHQEGWSEDSRLKVGGEYEEMQSVAP